MPGSAHWYHEPVEIDLARNSAAAIEVPLALGGRVRLSVVDARGEHLRARCKLSDPSGRSVDLAIVTRDTDGSSNVDPHELGGTGFSAPSDLHPDVAPGLYRLSLSLPGYRSQSLPVEVVAGRTTELQVVLQAE